MPGWRRGVRDSGFPGPHRSAEPITDQDSDQDSGKDTRRQPQPPPPARCRLKGCGETARPGFWRQSEERTELGLHYQGLELLNKIVEGLPTVFWGLDQATQDG